MQNVPHSKRNLHVFSWFWRQWINVFLLYPNLLPTLFYLTGIEVNTDQKTDLFLGYYTQRLRQKTEVICTSHSLDLNASLAPLIMSLQSLKQKA